MKLTSGFTRKFIIGILYYAIVSFGVIIFADPLFRVLGFEYSSIIALAVSVHLLFYTSERAAASPNKGKIFDTFMELSQAAIIFPAIPLLISVLSAFFIPNCDLGYGIMMYVEVVYPTAACAVLLGINNGWWWEKRRSRIVANCVLWLVTFMISLAPGYFYPQMFIYGWQFGYFPGFVWDPALSLKPAYWWSRGFELFYGFHFVYGTAEVVRAGAKTKEERAKVKQKHWVIFGIATVAIEVSLSFVGITVPHSTVESKLSATITTPNAITIYFDSTEYTSEEREELRNDAEVFADEIRNFYGITTKKKLAVYLYSSGEQMERFVGTRHASITKPWRSEIHLARENLSTLKHELVHAILGDYGNFPISASWSTGLTEGSAVAAEDDYDGIHDCNEHAARIIQLGYAESIQQIMNFAGFASNAASKSYVLAGSFSSYLIQNYGAERYLRLYSSRNYEAEYGKSLAELDAEWLASLQVYQSAPTTYDSLRTAFYFDRTSIMQEPCLRRIGRMSEQAHEMYADRQYAEASEMYDEIIKEDNDNLRAIRGKTLSLIHLGRYSEALAAVTAAPARVASALHSLKGDCIIFAGNDTSQARAEWNVGMKLELSEGTVLSAYIRYHYIASLPSDERKKLLLQLYMSDKASSVYLPIPQGKTRSAHSAYLVLKYQLQRRDGNVRSAYEYAKKILDLIGDEGERESEIVKNAMNKILRHQ